jgi:hypothetical protein
MNSVPGPTVHEKPAQIIGAAFIWMAIFCFYEVIAKGLDVNAQLIACLIAFIIGLLLIDH